jgi:integrase/recombinase XerD
MKREDLKNYNLDPLGKFNIEKVFCTIILDLRREKDDGCYPVKYCVTHKTKRAYYPAIDLTPEEFSNLHKNVKGANQVKTKKLIMAGFERVIDNIKDLMQKEPFTFEKLARRIKKGSSDSVIDAFNNKISELTDKGKIGTSDWYKCAKISIEKFAKKDMKFADITSAWLEKYEANLLKEGKEYTTISINMRALRAIMNLGLRDGIITSGQYPFSIKNNGKYQIPEGKGRKIALSTAQLIKVFNYPVSADAEIWKDLWIFSFYCNGANIGDILRFKNENLVGNYIEWYRKKTISTDKDKSKIRAVLTEEMQEIINRWGNRDKRPGSYIFKILTPGLSPAQESATIKNTLHTINKKMKAIGKALGYGDITTYWARHSWASISRHEGVSLFGISKGMGHKNLSTTQIYLDSLSDDELKNNAALLPRRNGNKTKTKKHVNRK